MSEQRIAEILGELRSEITRTEHFMRGSGVQPYLQYSTGALTEILAHIDALTRERDELKAACEYLYDAANCLRSYISNANTNAKWIDAAIAQARSTLDATASGKGE